MSKEERQERWGKSGEKNGMYGRTHTDEVKKRLSIINKGREPPNKGKQHSEETKLYLSKVRKGKYTGEKNHFFGKNHSEETKQKIREKNKGRLPTNIREVIINGKTYISASDAGRQLNVCTATILHRIKSPNPIFANYFYVNAIQDEVKQPSLF
jgi:group I intron endonuclease